MDAHGKRQSILVSLMRREGFTSTDDAIADYVISHLVRSTELTIGELARESHSSKSAIMRLCARLGLDGYRTFKVQLAREVERAYAFGVNPDLPFERESDTRHVADAIAALQKRAVDDTRALLDPEMLARAGERIAEASRIILYGIGDSASAVDQFSGLLLKSGIVAVSGYMQNGLFNVAPALGPGDVPVIVSYSGGLLRRFDQIPNEAIRLDLKGVAMSSNYGFDGRRWEGYIILRLPRYENPAERIAPFYSQACVRYALSCLYGEVLTRTWSASTTGQKRYLDLGIFGD